ncbi:sensor histidine kinase [Halostreptopolyspora alba]|uniref:sensor histidine kinase n=1 Tax=Halostreptopolyspora alba TaxID=2487137 RepID=UPI003713A108
MTVGSVAVLAVILVVTTAVASLLVRNAVENGVSEQAASAARNIAQVISDRPTEEPIPPQNGVVRIQVVDLSGGTVASSAAMEGVPPVTDVRPGPNDPQVETTECGASQVASDCLSVVGVEVTDSAYGTVLVYAAVPLPQFLSLGILEIGLASMGLIVLFLSGAGVWWAVARTLRPVRDIRTELERITAADLSHRVPTPDTGDEIAELARTVNETLERLESAVSRQRRFISDASHELRTPVAGLRTRLELAMAEVDERDPRGALATMLGDTDRLQQIIDDLLRLARLDSETARSREPIDLGELAETETTRQVLECEVTVRATPGVVVDGNRSQISRLLVNLLANAGRHATGRVLVTVTAEDGWAVLRMHDDGSGVPVEDRDRVFERFARLNDARGRDPGGTGLGLPIAQEIAQVHGGSLRVEDSTELGGAVFEIRLPLRGEETARHQ